MFDKAVKSDVNYRPHFKTHQSIEVGRWFREIGTKCITVSSLRMARYFAEDGWDDITVAFPVNIREIELIKSLAAKIKLGLVVEDPTAVEILNKEISDEINLWIKLDTGSHRTGLELADLGIINQIINLSSSISPHSFQGFLTHAGHTYDAESPQAVLDIYEESVAIMKRVKQSVIQLSGRTLLSWGDTPSCSLKEDFNEIDEIRPGNFVFYDLMQWLKGNCSFNQIAGILVCPVVAKHPKRGEVIIYGGAVHLSKDRITNGEETIYGLVVEPSGSTWSAPVEGARIIKLSQEHGVIQAHEKWIRGIQTGDLIGVVPVHSCLTTNLSSDFLTTEGISLSHFRSL